MNPWASVVEKVLRFLEEKLPSILAAFSVGYSLSKGRLEDAERKLKCLQLKLRYKDNEDEVRKELSGLSDRDVIRHALESKRKRDSEDGDNG